MSIIRIHGELDPDTWSQQTERRRRRAGLTTWRCDGCGLVSTWGTSWSWWGSELDLEDLGVASIRVACSKRCKAKARG